MIRVDLETVIARRRGGAPQRGRALGAAVSLLAAMFGFMPYLRQLFQAESDVPRRVIAFRNRAAKFLLAEQWLLLIPIAVVAHALGNSALGVLAVGGAFALLSTLSFWATGVEFQTRAILCLGLLMDILLLIYALTGAGSWQMDGGHMWIFAIWSHCLALLCWRSLLVSGVVGVLHHYLLIYMLPLWVFPDEASLWRVLLHGGVVAMQMAALCIFVVLIVRMLRNAEKLEASLSESVDRSAELSDTKSRFLAHMSHELRTPLNAILGFSEVIAQAHFGPVQNRYRDYASDIHNSGHHLLSLINDVLDISKIEAGRLALRRERIEILALARDCIHLVDGRAREQGVQVGLELPAGLTVTADEIRLKQIALNLLTNAVKFTRRGGEVVMGGKRLPNGGTALWVRDTGIGMTTDEIATALEPFGQVENPSVSRGSEGTGLGLPLASRLAKLHGGSLEITSEKGKGTEVRVELPASDPCDMICEAERSAV